MQSITELLSKVSKFIKSEYIFIMDDDEEEYRSDCPVAVTDSFGKLSIIGQSEPEDAIWIRDLQYNFYAGVEIGVRNTVKVLAEHPELLKQYQESLKEQTCQK